MTGVDVTVPHSMLEDGLKYDNSTNIYTNTNDRFAIGLNHQNIPNQHLYKKQPKPDLKVKNGIVDSNRLNNFTPLECDKKIRPMPMIVMNKIEIYPTHSMSNNSKVVKLIETKTKIVHSRSKVAKIAHSINNNQWQQQQSSNPGFGENERSRSQACLPIKQCFATSDLIRQ